MITDYIDVLDEKGIFRFSRHKILKFADKFKSNLYLFGHGKISDNIEVFLNDNGYVVQGYVVSKPINSNEISLDDFSKLEKKGVIVALGERALSEVMDDIVNKIPSECVVMPKK
jgi:hypothetical protein